MTLVHILAISVLFTSASATAVPSLPSLDQATLTVRDDCLQAIRGFEQIDASLGGYSIIRIVAAYGQEEDQGVYHCRARFERMDHAGGLSIGSWSDFYRRVIKD